MSGGSFTVAAHDVIVAAGGLESTRLLMCSPGREGKSIGDHSGHLGHWYMAHMEGVIANLVLSTPAEETIWDTSATLMARTSGGGSPLPRAICSNTACRISPDGSPTRNWRMPRTAMRNCRFVIWRSYHRSGS